MSLHVKQTANMKMLARTSPEVQWLRLCASTSGGMGSIPGLGAKLPQDLHKAKQTNKKRNEKKMLDNQSDEKM